MTSSELKPVNMNTTNSLIISRILISVTTFSFSNNQTAGRLTVKGYTEINTGCACQHCATLHRVRIQSPTPTSTAPV